MTKLYTADLHFGHSRILEYGNRPWRTVEEMDEGLIKNWNEVVGNGDIVYILGDFTLRTRRAYIEPVLRQLHGHKVLIQGNHDQFVREKNLWWLRQYFEEIVPYKETYDGGLKLVLCHYPILYWNGQDEARRQTKSFHLYGHVHSDLNFQHPHPDAFNVGVDVRNYRPITLEQLLTGRTITVEG